MMSIHRPGLMEIVRSDPRYALEAYEFVFEALDFTHQALGRPSVDPAVGDEPGPEHHVTGQELVDGVRALALREFGRMARIVFRLWGVNRTDDFGEIVFNLIEANLMSKTAKDERLDFHNLYDLDQVLVHNYRIELPDEPEGA
jgi:uncharacterized repeat protein (TIGR04138 family)